MIPRLEKEFIYKAVRSSGKGGQNVNKVSTKIEVYFNTAESNILTDQQKTILAEKLKHIINEDGFIRIVSQESRSQLANKENATDKLIALIAKALEPTKKRVKTKTPRSVKEKRLEGKKKRGEIKSLRRKPGDDSG